MCRNDCQPLSLIQSTFSLALSKRGFNLISWLRKIGMWNENGSSLGEKGCYLFGEPWFLSRPTFLLNCRSRCRFSSPWNIIPSYTSSSSSSHSLHLLLIPPPLCKLHNCKSPLSPFSPWFVLTIDVVLFSCLFLSILLSVFLIGRQPESNRTINCFQGNRIYILTIYVVFAKNQIV